MRMLLILMLAGCSNMISPTDSPEKKAAYAECEKNAPGFMEAMSKGGYAHALNECMKAKGY